MEEEIREARIKPDEILMKIARRFGFKLGIPQHEFCKGIETRVNLSGVNAICFVRKAEYYGRDCFFYQYTGPVVESRKVKIVDYTAYVFENFQTCFGGDIMMVVRDKNGRRTSPQWFPNSICRYR